jgi:hypothetical protein
MKPKIDPALLERAQSILTKKGARSLATACLSLAAKRICGLSIQDLPDLPCGMYFRDQWQETWEGDGLSAGNLASAMDDANDCVRSILAEEGFAFCDREGNET